MLLPRHVTAIQSFNTEYEPNKLNKETQLLALPFQHCCDHDITPSSPKLACKCKAQQFYHQAKSERSCIVD